MGCLYERPTLNHGIFGQFYIKQRYISIEFTMMQVSFLHESDCIAEEQALLTSSAVLNEEMNRCVSIGGVGAVRKPPLQAFIPRISNATSSSTRLIEPTLATYGVNDIDDLTQHIQVCHQEQFTGRLDLSIQSNQNSQWSLFFQMGRLGWSTGEMHPIRRWNRQLFQRYPQLTLDSTQQGANQLQCSDYDALIKLVRQKKVQPSYLAEIVVNTITEILFDIIQARHQLRHRLGMQVTYRQGAQHVLNSMSITFSTAQIWEQVICTWDIWQQAGLASFSPNLAPVIWDTDELRQQASLLSYHNLTKLIDGNWTLRDLAIKLRQPLLPLTKSLMPYIYQRIMGLTQIGDISYFVEPMSGPLIAYIEDSRFDSAAMRHILAQAGYRFINIQDATQALPMLLEYKPNLIFLDLLMPIANGYEVCAQIRRVSAFKDTPIIILTSSDGIVDRVRAKLIGSSGFLAKPIDQEKVMSALQQYLPV
jgi:two-component system, chemotaxis family, response regulator PixG